MISIAYLFLKLNACIPTIDNILTFANFLPLPNALIFQQIIYCTYPFVTCYYSHGMCHVTVDLLLSGNEL